MGFRALMVAFAVFTASTVWAKTDRLQPAQVRLLGYVGDKLEVAIEMSCGAEFLGLITSPKKDGRLEVAAAVRSPDIVCTSLPEGKHILVDYLATRGFKTIAPMDVSSWKGRLVLAPIKDLRLYKNKRDGQRVLDGVYDTRCGQHVGTVIMQAEEGLQVAFAEHLLRGQRSNDCPTEQRTKRIQAIDLRSGLKITTWRKASGENQRSYELRVTTIDPKSFRRRQQGGLTFQYLRQCNEAPVGIVVGKRSLKKRVGGAPIRRAMFGMLVARYPQRKCSEAEATETWTTYETKDVSLPAGWRAAMMPATQPGQTLSLRTPMEFAKAEKRSKKGLFVDFVKGCDLPLGAVYARSPGSADTVLSVGVLNLRSGKTCKKQVSQASLFQPFVSQKVSVDDMFPLRIQGAAAH